MSKARIDVSGAAGGGCSVKIYETPDYAYPWQGACLMHGSFTAGPTSPDSQRIEVVELNMPGIEIRVKAAEVQAELGALLTANEAWRDAAFSTDQAAARHLAFDALRTAVVGRIGKHITVKHLETIVQGFGGFSVFALNQYPRVLQKYPGEGCLDIFQGGAAVASASIHANTPDSRLPLQRQTARSLSNAAEAT